MKRHQEQKDRRGLAGLMAGTKVGDRSGLLQGEFANPAAYQSMANTDAANALKTAQMESTAANNLARIEGRNQTNKYSQDMNLLLMKGRESGLNSRQVKELNAEKNKYTFLAGEKRDALGIVNVHETALLSSKNKAAFRNTEFARASAEKMQIWSENFKAGQSSDTRKQQVLMSNLNASHEKEKQAIGNTDAVAMKKLEQKQKKEVNVLQNAFKAGESNKQITSTEMLKKMDDSTTREISENRLKVKTSMNAIDNETKKFSVKYTQDSSNWRTKFTQDSTRERMTLGQIHETTMQSTGNAFKASMVGVKAKIASEKALFGRQTEAINIELQGAVGERKIKLENELKAVESRIKHSEDKEMASSNAYLKEEMQLKNNDHKRATAIAVAEIKANSERYKTMQKSATLGTTMRKEFNAMTDDFITGLEPLYMNAVESMRKTSPAGDKAILFAYARYLKPDSNELRKHTTETLQNMSGMPGFLRDLWRKVKGGKEILNPAERKDIFSRLQEFHGKHLQNYRGKLKTYQGMAELSGVQTGLISDLSNTKNILPFAENEGSGATESGVYMSDTDLPDFGLSQMLLEAAGGMGGSSTKNIENYMSGGQPGGGNNTIMNPGDSVPLQGGGSMTRLD
tara:strand:- start:493 stop:2376 length:1884 start_codon:yes stop_codon:yes gene_type:complete